MKKGLSLIFLVGIILLLQHADLSRATSGNVNSSLTTACGGSVDCLIGDDMDDVMEFQMSSHVARMLADASTVTKNTGNKNKPAVDCHPKNKYTGCIGSPSGGSTKQPCGAYTRGCR